VPSKRARELSYDLQRGLDTTCRCFNADVGMAPSEDVLKEMPEQLC
jgi:hypothetical protein